MILGSKGQKSRLELVLQKHIEGDRVAGVSYALYQVPSFVDEFFQSITWLWY